MGWDRAGLEDDTDGHMGQGSEPKVFTIYYATGTHVLHGVSEWQFLPRTSAPLDLDTVSWTHTDQQTYTLDKKSNLS